MITLLLNLSVGTIFWFYDPFLGIQKGRIDSKIIEQTNTYFGYYSVTVLPEPTKYVTHWNVLPENILVIEDK